jgi:hypothetical protein
MIQVKESYKEILHTMESDHEESGNSTYDHTIKESEAKNG